MIRDLIYDFYTSLLVKWEAFKTYLLKKPNFNFLDDKLAIGSRPINYEIYKKYNIKAILNLREEGEDNLKVIDKLGFDYFRIPVKDGYYPSWEDIERALIWIEDKIKEGKRVLIHCKSGKGRAPFLACFYLLRKGYSLDEAINFIKSKRRSTFFNKVQREALIILSKSKL
ncbi:hypothetical protein HRbin06_00097 [archaeon HR06]|nr:hypothetical protein HRbin06_00097 [archaeon HR06]